MHWVLSRMAEVGQEVGDPSCTAGPQAGCCGLGLSYATLQ